MKEPSMKGQNFGRKEMASPPGQRTSSQRSVGEAVFGENLRTHLIHRI